jgi:DNA-binding beta-propeller fold protein YncE
VFGSGNSGAFVADAASHQILRVQGLDSTPVITPIISSEPYVKDPVGLVLSEDDSRIFIADRASSTVRVFESGAGALIAELPLDAAPLSLTPVSAGRFLLDPANSADPFLFLDTESPIRVSFVPRGE